MCWRSWETLRPPLRPAWAWPSGSPCQPRPVCSLVSDREEVRLSDILVRAIANLLLTVLAACAETTVSLYLLESKNRLHKAIQDSADGGRLSESESISEEAISLPFSNLTIY